MSNTFQSVSSDLCQPPISLASPIGRCLSLIPRRLAMNAKSVSLWLSSVLSFGSFCTLETIQPSVLDEQPAKTKLKRTRVEPFFRFLFLSFLSFSRVRHGRRLARFLSLHRETMLTSRPSNARQRYAASRCTDDAARATVFEECVCHGEHPTTIPRREVSIPSVRFE